MQTFYLNKRYKNHAAGTILSSVSPGIKAELEKLGCIEPESYKVKDIIKAAEDLKAEQKKKKSVTKKKKPAEKKIK